MYIDNFMSCIYSHIIDMSTRLTIQQASDILGVSTKTLRRWEGKRYFIPEREPGTNIRFYDPDVVSYWNKLIKLHREIRKHIGVLNDLRKEIDRHMIEQNYIPGKPLKLLSEESFKKFKKAYSNMKKWNDEYKNMIEELIAFPVSMREVSRDREEK
jgi:DNA-binding transcriptional MerR regulator